MTNKESALFLSLERKAFTLVELLVVVAILCVLFALLFPVIINIRVKAHQAMCVSNLHQLYTGFHMYATDFYQKMVPVWHGKGGDWVGYYVNRNNMPESGRLWPYIQEKKVYLCPADTLWRDPANVCWVPKVGTHSYAAAHGRYRDPYFIIDAAKALLVDESETTLNDGFFVNAWDTFASRHNYTGRGMKNRANAGGNILFCDGHVEFFRASGIIGANLPMFK